MQETINTNPGLALLVLGLGQTFYFVAGPDAFVRDQTGHTLIAAGAVLALGAAAWAFSQGRPLWVVVTVAAPAVVIGGLTLLASDSLLPHIGALLEVPAGVAGHHRRHRIPATAGRSALALDGSHRLDPRSLRFLLPDGGSSRDHRFGDSWRYRSRKGRRSFGP